jgi:hypothetical protein
MRRQRESIRPGSNNRHIGGHTSHFPPTIYFWTLEAPADGGRHFRNMTRNVVLGKSGSRLTYCRSIGSCGILGLRSRPRKQSAHGSGVAIDVKKVDTYELGLRSRSVMCRPTWAATKRPLMTSTALPRQGSVVFVDDAPWECFFHLAVMLRKYGIRTIRVSVGMRKWQPENFLFDRHISLSKAPTPAELSKLLESEYIIDAQPVENLAETTYSALDLLPAPQRSDLWSGRSVFLDKWDVANTLQKLGIRTPDTLLADSVSPVQAVEKFSLPIVFKPRVGSSGSGVEVFHTLESLQEFVSKIELLEEWFFERFVEGESLVCALCLDEVGIDVVATYETIERVNFRGPSTVAIMRNEPSIVRIGEKLAEAMGIRGFLCFDVIRDLDGIDWIHDVNPRVFGTVSMCQLAGFDFRGAYIKCLTGVGAVMPTQFNESGVKSFTFPSGFKEVLHAKQSRSSWLRTIGWTWSYERLLGPRYFLSWAIRSLIPSYRNAAKRDEMP